MLEQGGEHAVWQGGAWEREPPAWCWSLVVRVSETVHLLGWVWGFFCVTQLLWWKLLLIFPSQLSRQGKRSVKMQR